jgi:hypothetical protein
MKKNTGDVRTLLGRMREIKNEIQMLNEAVKRDVTDEEKNNEESGFKSATGEPVQTIFFQIFPDNVVWTFAVPRANLKVTYSLETEDSIFVEIMNPERQDDVSGTNEKVKGYITLTEGMLNIIKGIRTYYKTFTENWIGELTGSDQTDKTN